MDWSLVKDAAKYDEAARAEDMVTLRSLIVDAPVSASLLPTPAPLTSTVVANPIASIESGPAEKTEGDVKQQDAQTDQQQETGNKEEKHRRRLTLGIALRYLDVTDMARSCCVCKDWRGKLVGNVILLVCPAFV